MMPVSCLAHRRVSLLRSFNVLLCALAVAAAHSLVSHAFVSSSLVRFSYRYGGGFPSVQQQGSCNNAAAAAACAAAARAPSSAATVAAQTSSPPQAYIRGAAAAAGRMGTTPGISAASADNTEKASSALFSESPAAAAAGTERSELLEKIKDVVADQLKVDRGKVHLESNFIKDLNADSLDSVELVMAFEEKFGVTIPDEAATKIATVQDALSYITNAT